MDAKSAFWQVKLTESSSYYITFNTSFVRFRWLRMPFGISSAPEVWQRKMKEPIEGLRGGTSHSWWFTSVWVWRHCRLGNQGSWSELNRTPLKVPQIKPDTQSSKSQAVRHFVNCWWHHYRSKQSPRYQGHDHPNRWEVIKQISWNGQLSLKVPSKPIECIWAAALSWGHRCWVVLASGSWWSCPEYQKSCLQGPGIEVLWTGIFGI